jgi:hypothetical protein
MMGGHDLVRYPISRTYLLSLNWTTSRQTFDRPAAGINFPNDVIIPLFLQKLAPALLQLNTVPLNK